MPCPVSFSFSPSPPQMSVPQTGLLLPQLLNILLWGLSLLPLGTAMPKVKRNGVLGLRTKWSMANDRCWELCQRAGGKSLLLTGVLLIAGSLLIGNRLWLNLLPIALLILDGIFCILYSLPGLEKIQQLKFFFFITFLHKRAILSIKLTKDGSFFLGGEVMLMVYGC